MSTKGNLEIRLGEKVLFASTTHDGYEVYKIVPALNVLLSEGEPSLAEYESWFRNCSGKIIPHNYSEHLIGGVPDEVIIDVPRRIILHTGNDEIFESVSKQFPGDFRHACIFLESNHNYHVLQYHRPEVRQEFRRIDALEREP